jgi:hypothetical protein
VAKKLGAQPKNSNALKHGFYSKRFTDDENVDLEGMDKLSIHSELDLLRVYMLRLADHVKLDTGEFTEKDLKAINTLALMAQSVSGMLRTQHLMKGKGGEILDGIEEALEELRSEMGL